MNWNVRKFAPSAGAWIKLELSGSSAQVLAGKQPGQLLALQGFQSLGNAIPIAAVEGFPLEPGNALWLWSPDDTDAETLLEFVCYEGAEFSSLSCRSEVPRSAPVELLAEASIQNVAAQATELIGLADPWMNGYGVEETGDSGWLRYREFVGQFWAQAGAAYSDDWEVLIWGDNGASAAVQIVASLPAVFDGGGTAATVQLEGVRVPMRRFWVGVRNNHATKIVRVTRTVGVIPWA